MDPDAYGGKPNRLEVSFTLEDTSNGSRRRSVANCLELDVLCVKRLLCFYRIDRFELFLVCVGYLCIL